MSQSDPDKSVHDEALKKVAAITEQLDRRNDVFRRLPSLRDEARSQLTILKGATLPNETKELMSAQEKDSSIKTLLERHTSALRLARSNSDQST